MTNVDLLHTWALRHGIGHAAIHELRQLMGHVPELSTEQACALKGKGESFVQTSVRLAAAQHGYQFFRNNVGALKDERGVPIRYGLANDTAALNKVVKSHDLIGWRSFIITDQHVGQRIAQFATRECKKPEWPGYDPTNEHERAQQRFADLVIAAGGEAAFTSGSFPG